jgi:hypothetical protein
MKFKTQNNLSKINKKQFHLFFIFSVLFFTQLSTFTHKIQHLENVDESICLICINTPDVLTDTSFKIEIVSIIEPADINFSQIKLIIKDSIRAYSIRAPPLFT